jgi:thioesterase domain-containing protein
MSDKTVETPDPLERLEATDNVQALQHYLLDCIPVLQHMEVGVESVDRDGVCVTAPLEPNSNHIGTAFGGSLHGLGTLSAWGLLWVLLRAHPDVSLVIRDSRMRYLEPANGPLRSCCPAPNLGTVNPFLRNISRRRKSAIELHSTVESNGRVCAEFSGVFVAIRKK